MVEPAKSGFHEIDPFTVATKFVLTDYGSPCEMEPTAGPVETVPVKFTLPATSEEIELEFGIVEFINGTRYILVPMFDPRVGIHTLGQATEAVIKRVIQHDPGYSAP